MLRQPVNKSKSYLSIQFVLREFCCRFNDLISNLPKVRKINKLFRLVQIQQNNYFFDLPKVSEMIHSEFESDFNFPINSASDFDSTSESGLQSESDFSSVFMNLDIYIFSHHS